nr:palmitoyltransferase ZDHHC16 [Ciona intestinalis]|eukprot:XP_002119544.1 palmitoyltransferase ZDHHC16 [Ciona intestinalis]
MTKNVYNDLILILVLKMRRIWFRFSLPFLKIYDKFQYIRLCYKSLTYNSFDSTAESAFEPVFCIVDFAVRWFGVAFVTVVLCLITSVVVIFYLHVLPYVLQTYNVVYSHLHILYGHYLLMMIVFHYYKAVRTDPGIPPMDISGVPVTSLCKKCILPKPPRTHHCSVCKNCRLKMDHHCPWLNNCVGHFNHRYFISFCIFMVMGTVYVSLSSWVLFNDCFKVGDKLERAYNAIGWTSNEEVHTLRVPAPPNTCTGKERAYNTSVVYLWILCSAVTVALGALTLWHVFLISRGETSIEKLVNEKERKRLKKRNISYRSPYNFGFIQNWKIILGFRTLRSFIRRVVLPSSHLPEGNGITWRSNIETSFIA